MELGPRSRARRAGDARRAGPTRGAPRGGYAPAIASALLLGACAPAPLAIELPRPGDGARVVVVAAPSARATSFFADARAADAVSSTLPYATVEADEPVDLVVLDYPATGDALGVDGVIDERVLGSETVARRPLDGWTRRRALRVRATSGAPAPAWTDAPEPGGAEQELALRQSSPCAAYAASRLLIAGDERPLFVRTTATTALLAFPSREGRTTWAGLRAEGAVPELVPVDEPLAGGRLTALVEGQGGELFAATQTATTTPPRNRLWRSAPGQPRFAPLADLDDGADEVIRWIAPVTGGAWVMSARGTLTRLERGRVAWRRPASEAPNRDGALVAFGLERAIALLPFARGEMDARRLLEVDADGVRVQTVDALEVASLHRLDRPEGPVVVAGTGRWGLSWLEALTTRPLYRGEELPIDRQPEVLALAQLDREGRALIAYAGTRATLGTYAFGFGPCSQTPIGGTAWSLIPFPGGILAAANLVRAEVPSGGMGVALWLERR